MSRRRWLMVVAVLAVALWVGRVHRDLPDFEVYRTAAARAASGETLYRPDDGHWQFKYLPAFAVIMAPFGVMPASVARMLWYAISVALLVAFVERSVAALPAKRLSHRALVWAAVLILGRFYVHELDLGQTNILLGFVLLLAAVATDAARPMAAGALVGASILIKPYGLIVLPWLAIAAGWRALVTAFAVVAAGLLLPAIVFGWSGNLAQIAAWYATVTETTAPNLGFLENISLTAMWTRWLGASPATPLLASVSGPLLFAAAASVLVWRRRAASPAYLELGLLMLLVPLLSPQGWDYVLLIATPAVLCVVNALPALRPAMRVPVVAALVVTGFTIFDLLGRSLYTRAMELSVVTIAALALIGALVQVRRAGLA